MAETGEPHFVRDQALLEMACERPKNKFCYGETDDLSALAVALLLGIAQLHPFEQGNKRTGLTCAIMFLQLNGCDARLPDSDELADLIEGVVERRIAQHHLVTIFRMGLVTR